MSVERVRRPRTARPGLVLGLVLAGAGAWAQEPGEPLSAIDWLSQSIRTAPPVRPPGDLATNALPEDVVTMPLRAVVRDAVGLLPPGMSGLPEGLLAGSDSERLADLISRQRPEAVPAMLDLLYRILLAELAPPADSGPEGRLFLARLDKLLDLGALDQAQALIERAGPTDLEIFRRWFDVSLLTGNEERACAAMRLQPDLAPTLPARIFCLARAGDWNAAAVTLATGETLGFITPAEAELLARFLDPELFEDIEDGPPPVRLTPLDLVMRDAAGLPRGPVVLPAAFAHADLGPTGGWKAQLEAAERLARTHAIPPSLLISLYAERAPAASGGVWDRARAVRALDIAVVAGDGARAGAALPEALSRMRGAGLAVPFARHYADRLVRLPLPTGPQVRKTLLQIVLLSDSARAAAPAFTAETPTETFLIALATGTPPSTVPGTLLARAIDDAFADRVETGTLRRELEAGRAGEALLQAMLLLREGHRSDPGDVARALALMRDLGLEEDARRAALHLMILSGAP